MCGRIARGAEPTTALLTPYVLGFAGSMLAGEIVWRIAVHCLIRAETNGIEDLYIVGMDELLARDAAFFHDNFAGSLTKRVLSFASQYEEFLDAVTSRTRCPTWTRSARMPPKRVRRSSTGGGSAS